MKILVTGGAGFIGSHLIDKLLSEGHEVINIDNFDPFYSHDVKRNNIANHFKYKNYAFFEADIRDQEKLRLIIDESVDTIIHLAAKAGVRPSLVNPVEYQEVNVTGTQYLLEVAREKGIKKFIFASSSSVYGKNKNVPWSENDFVLKPISPYASTKVSGELLGHVYSHLYDINFIALRFFTVFGPRQRPDLAIHKFFNLVLNGKTISLYGDGSSRRDYTYIEDIIDGIMSSLTYSNSKYEIINLGNNKTTKLLELVRLIEKVLGTNVEKIHMNEQPGDVAQTWANIEKAKKLIDYRPDTSVEEGLYKFKEWYLNNHQISVTRE
jgi:UDP-glucuronate 4-epimerase